MSTSLSIVGAGGHGRVIADCAMRMGCWNVIQFFDDSVAGRLSTTNWNVIGPVSRALAGGNNTGDTAFVGIGDNAQRVSLQAQLELAGWKIASIIDPTAIVSSGASIGAGTVIMPNTIVNIGAEIGTSCIVNTKASVDHDCKLDTGVHISPGATLCGGVTIGERCWIGAGATIIQNIRVGCDTTVGAGAVVIRDVPANTTCAGNPARIFKK